MSFASYYSAFSDGLLSELDFVSRYFFNIATVILNKYIFQGELSFAPKALSTDDVHTFHSTHKPTD